jgi:hypothetical protein
MNIQELFNAMYQYKGLKCKYSSISDLKKFIEHIHNEYMKDALFTDAQWINTGEFHISFAFSDINIIIELIKTFSAFHPKLDEFLETMVYFKNYSEEIGSRFFLKGKTFDIHNCLLQSDTWTWSTEIDGQIKKPQAIRTTLRSAVNSKNPDLQNIFNMIDASYNNLNVNAGNCIKGILQNDGGGGYKSNKITNKEPHGFPLVGDIHPAIIMKDIQKELRVKLTDIYAEGSLRLLNYLDYTNSKKTSAGSFSDITPININIEDDGINIDFTGAKINKPVEKTNENVLIPE